MSTHTHFVSKKEILRDTKTNMQQQLEDIARALNKKPIKVKKVTWSDEGITFHLSEPLDSIAKIEKNNS